MLVSIGVLAASSRAGNFEDRVHTDAADDGVADSENLKEVVSHSYRYWTGRKELTNAMMMKVSSRCHFLTMKLLV